MSFGLDVGERELDLSINSTRSDEGGIKGFDFIRRHNDLHISSCIKSIQLIQQLQHGSLDFTFSS